jgi:type IV pilus assembly protein PilN
MRRLNASDWFAQPNLEGVRAAPNFGEQATTFNMTVMLRLPETENEDEG